MPDRVYNLEERLRAYSTSIIRLVEGMNQTRAGNYVGGQLLRSGLSPYFNHGEAESAESPKDFTHKLKICLKELRESERALKLVKTASLVQSESQVESLLAETDELIRIFVASIRTAEKRVIREDSIQGYEV
jgi:four helix bundle protein